MNMSILRMQMCCLLLLGILAVGSAQSESGGSQINRPASRFTIGAKMGFGTYWRCDGCNNHDFIASRQLGLQTEYRVFRILSLLANMNVFRYQDNDLVYFDNGSNIFNPYHIRSRVWMPTLALGMQLQFRLGQGDVKIFGDFGYALHDWTQSWTGASGTAIEVDFAAELHNYRSWGAGYQFWPHPNLAVDIAIMFPISDFQLGNRSRQSLEADELARFPIDLQDSIGMYRDDGDIFFETFFTCGISYRLSRSSKR